MPLRNVTATCYMRPHTAHEALGLGVLACWALGNPCKHSQATQPRIHADGTMAGG